MTSIIIYISSVLVATIVWSIRLEGRVNTAEKLTDQRFDDLKELMNTHFAGSNARLERVERSMNGHLKD